jgi:hypothetical protein
VEEDTKIIELYNKIGGKWIKIAKEFPGRCPDAIKNRYYSVLRKHSNSIKGFGIAALHSNVCKDESYYTNVIKSCSEFLST